MVISGWLLLWATSEVLAGLNLATHEWIGDLTQHSLPV